MLLRTARARGRRDRGGVHGGFAGRGTEHLTAGPAQKVLLRTAWTRARRPRSRKYDGTAGVDDPTRGAEVARVEIAHWKTARSQSSTRHERSVGRFRFQTASRDPSVAPVHRPTSRDLSEVCRKSNAKLSCERAPHRRAARQLQRRDGIKRPVPQAPRRNAPR